MNFVKKKEKLYRQTSYQLQMADTPADWPVTADAVSLYSKSLHPQVVIAAFVARGLLLEPLNLTGRA